jgi:hypothetical protein
MPPTAPLWCHIFYLWPWRMTLTFHHSKCATPWDTHACQIWSCYLQYCKMWPLILTLKDDLDLSPLKMCSSMRYACMPNIELLSLILQNLTFDLDLEGWPWPFTTHNVKLHKIPMHAKYRVAIFNIAKFDPWPWRMTFHHS